MAELIAQPPMPAEELAGRIATYRGMFPFAKEPTEREAMAIVETWWKALAQFPRPFIAEAFDWWILDHTRMPTVADIVTRAKHNLDAALFRAGPAPAQPAPAPRIQEFTPEEQEQRRIIAERIKAQVEAKRLGGAA